MQQQLQLWRSWAAGEMDDATAQAAAEAAHARKLASKTSQRASLSHGGAQARARRCSVLADASRSTVRVMMPARALMGARRKARGLRRRHREGPGRVAGAALALSWLFPCSVDSSSILIAIGSLAGNVSFSASSSSSSRCAIAAGRGFCVFFGVSMTLGAFFAFLVIACLHQQPKGGAHLRVERGPESRFCE
jgi:hypothetical protein